MFDLLDMLTQLLQLGNSKAKTSFKNNRGGKFLDIFGTIFLILLFLIFILVFIYQTIVILGKLIGFSW